MKSLRFPDMLGPSSVRTVTDKEATKQNLVLLLQSVQGTLSGDPNYGSTLVTLLYNQNSVLLVDIIKDELTSKVQRYMPQITLLRNDIEIVSDGTNVYAILKLTYNIDGSSDLYTIRLISDEEE